MRKRQAIRVLHCPTMIGGNPQNLARAEREIGLESWSVTYKQSFLNYNADQVLWDERYGQLGLEVKRWHLLWSALRDYDIIHFNFGESILPRWVSQSEPGYNRYRWPRVELYRCYARIFELRDLYLLKKAGKGIVVTYQGDDARQGDNCLANFAISPAREVDDGYYSPESDAHKRFRIGVFGKYADRIYALNPDLMHVLPPTAEFLPYAHIDLRDWRAAEGGKPPSEVPVVVHAPSHRGVKGTRFVIDAVSRLKAEGVALDFIMVEGLSHAKARKVYEQADLGIDQLLCGWYGGFGVEMMALSKPVICYIRENDLQFISEQMGGDLPIIRATPETFYDVLKEWLTVRRHETNEIGRRGRAYVEKWHDPLKIATRLKGDYEAILQSKQHVRSH